MGEPANPATAITLNKGWSWIGYPLQASNSLSSAFDGAYPQEGDIVKDQSSFAMYTGGDWMNAHYGTMTQPFVLQLAEADGIDLAQVGTAIKGIQLFDGSGRLVRSTDRPSRLYSRNDLKGLPAGVYYQQVTFADGHTIVQKIMR